VFVCLAVLFALWLLDLLVSDVGLFVVVFLVVWYYALYFWLFPVCLCCGFLLWFVVMFDFGDYLYFVSFVWVWGGFVCFGLIFILVICIIVLR